MCSGFFVIWLGKSADKIFKYISHVNRADFLWGKITFICAKVRDDLIQKSRFFHVLNLRIKIHPGKNVLNIVRKSIQIGSEIIYDIFRVSNQCLECKWTGIVKLIARCCAQETVFHIECFVFFICIQNSLMCWQQAVMKPLNDRHRQNNKTIFMRFVCSYKIISHRPDQRCCIIGILSNICN